MSASVCELRIVSIFSARANTCELRFLSDHPEINNTVLHHVDNKIVSQAIRELLQLGKIKRRTKALEVDGMRVVFITTEIDTTSNFAETNKKIQEVIASLQSPIKSHI